MFPGALEIPYLRIGSFGFPRMELRTPLSILNTTQNKTSRRDRLTSAMKSFKSVLPLLGENPTKSGAAGLIGFCCVMNFLVLAGLLPAHRNSNIFKYCAAVLSSSTTWTTLNCRYTPFSVKFVEPQRTEIGVRFLPSILLRTMYLS